MKERIYIAGKITGMEAEAKILFEEAEQKLLRSGFDVVNPMKLPHQHDRTWESYMNECIPALRTCTAMILLPNWKDSRGAREEVIEAVDKDITIVKF